MLMPPVVPPPALPPRAAPLVPLAPPVVAPLFAAPPDGDALPALAPFEAPLVAPLPGVPPLDAPPFALLPLPAAFALPPVEPPPAPVELGASLLPQPKKSASTEARSNVTSRFPKGTGEQSRSSRYLEIKKVPVVSRRAGVADAPSPCGFLLYFRALRRFRAAGWEISERRSRPVP